MAELIGRDSSGYVAAENVGGISGCPSFGKKNPPAGVSAAETVGDFFQCSICTMHLAKGLEFKAVAVMACDEDVIPSIQRIEAVGEDSDLSEVYNTERHLLYVACTRARDHLLVTGINPVSEFVDDLSFD